MQFTRVATYRATDPGQVNEMTKQFQDELAPLLSSSPGFQSYGVALDSTDPSKIVAVSRWDDEESARQATNRISDFLNDSGIAQKITLDNEVTAEYAFRTDAASVSQQSQQ